MIQHPAPLNLLSKAHDHPLTQSHNLDIVRLLSVSESGLSSFSCFNVRPYPFPSSHSHPFLAHVGQRSIQHGIVEGKDRRPGGDVFDVGLDAEHCCTWHEALHEALHEVPSLCHHWEFMLVIISVHTGVVQQKQPRNGTIPQQEDQSADVHRKNRSKLIFQRVGGKNSLVSEENRIKRASIEQPSTICSVWGVMMGLLELVTPKYSKAQSVSFCSPPGTSNYAKSEQLMPLMRERKMPL